MAWQPDIDDPRHREGLAEQMGGLEGIERQRKRGKHNQSNSYIRQKIKS